MKMEVDFSDGTVEYALQRHCLPSDIEKICGTLGRYAVSCFDIRLCTYRQYRQAGNPLATDRMRCLLDAAEITQAAGFRQIAVRVRQSGLNGLKEPVAAVRAIKGTDIYLFLEDAWRMRPEEFETAFVFAKRHGIKGILYGSNGTENLFELYGRLCAVVQDAPCPVEFKASDSCHMATAHTLAALRAGVGRVGTSAAGIGGSAPLEEVMMSAGRLLNAAIPSGRTLAGDLGVVLSGLGARVPAQKVLIGSNIFAHESGIHVDGIVKNPSLYEVIRPEDVGLTRRLIIGKHSGNASIRVKLLQHGIRLSRQDATVLLNRVRKLAQQQKRSLTDEELFALYKECIAKGGLAHVGCKSL